MGHIKSIIRSFYGLYMDRKVLLGLAKNDLKSRFKTSFLGAFWAFMIPLNSMLVMWYIFTTGFRNPPVDDYPFIVWFVPAYLSWTFFADALTSSASSFEEYRYLLKQVNFRTSMIPAIKVLSAAFIHIIFFVFIIIVLLANGMPVTWNALEVLYYFFSMMILVVGLALFNATLKVFIPDIGGLVAVITQIGFWVTPVCWNPEVQMEMSENGSMLFRLNPMYYICEGYRESFLSNIHFWEHPETNVIFWVETLFVLILGIIVYKKMSPYLVDMM